MGSRTAIAIDIGAGPGGQRRLRAVQGVRTRGRKIAIGSVLNEPFPTNLDVGDVGAVGKWIGQTLRSSGFSLGNAVIAIGRDRVGLKRLTLPTVEAAELPEMTRLAMQRELPFDSDASVIDFVPLVTSQRSTTVLAAAAPRELVDFARNVARQAGLNVQRITLRSMGVSALISNAGLFEQGGSKAVVQGSSNSTQGAMLAIDITQDGVEFCVTADGLLHFSRAAEVPQPQDQLAIAEAVVTEARRTWMSFRATDDGINVQCAALLGDHRVSAYAAEPLRKIIDVPVHVVHEHPLIDAGGENLNGGWALAGLLLESESGLDFAHPRKAPDLGAKMRQRRLLIAGSVVVGIAAIWTGANLHLKSMAAEVQRLEALRTQKLPQYDAHRRDVVKLEHLKRWENAAVNWLQHAAHLTSISPPPDQLVLDSWTGILEFGGVGWDRKTSKWFTSKKMSITLDGEARDRATADAFRGTLVKADLYDPSTSGPDAPGGKRLPFGFTYRLRTLSEAPSVDAANNSDSSTSTEESVNVEPSAEASR